MHVGCLSGPGGTCTVPHCAACMYVCIDAMGRGDGMFLFISWWRGGDGGDEWGGEG